MIDYGIILAVRHSKSQWALNGGAYEGLEWLDDTPKPTQEELDAAWPEVQREQQMKQVESQRKAAYTTESDPVFFRWQRGDATEAEWREAVAKVKADNPYPA
jgi:hypothetical protein